MGPKSKKHSKGKTTDRPKPAPNPPSSHIVGHLADFPKVSLELQQLMLNIFRDALPISADSDLKQTIQDVKGYLYHRDFASAFGSSHFLHAYALRWSASRALAYAEIIAEFDVKYRWLEDQSTTTEDKTQNVDDAKVLCIGGGAGAEVVALAAIFSRLSLSHLSVIAVDVADWSSVLSKLTSTITKPPLLSQYASAAKKDANRALLDSSRFNVDFRQQDILECLVEELGLLVADASLVTIMFTLNELFSTSIAKTTAFLLRLTEVMKPGSWLLVVDSPGSYSEVTVGKESEAKRYPMKWLLDHALQQAGGADVNGVSTWRKFVDNDSRWFRLNDKLSNSLELESMRYQVQLYLRQAPEHRSEIDS